MGRVYRQFFSAPLPPNSTIAVIDGKRYAQWTKAGKPQTAELTKSGDKIRVAAAKWYADYTDSNGVKHEGVALHEDETKARHMLADLERGVVFETPQVTAKTVPATLPLPQLLDAFEVHLKSERKTEKHVQMKMRHVRKLLLEWAAFTQAGELDSTRIQSIIMAKVSCQQTQNHFLSETKSFTKWLLAEEHVARDVLAKVKVKTVTERKRNRRPLTQEELQQLLLAAMTSDKVFRGLSGRDRHFQYTVAAYTGFRCGEISKLTPAHFFFDGDFPFIFLAKKDTKNKKDVHQNLPRSVANELATYLEGKPKNERIWPGNWFKKSAIMLRIDLKRAGIEYVTDEPEGKVYVDYHALRYTAGDLYDLAGFSQKQQMKAMRHSNANLTMGTYSRKAIAEMGEVMDRLPNLLTHEYAAKAIQYLQDEVTCNGDPPLPAPYPSSMAAFHAFLQTYDEHIEKMVADYKSQFDDTKEFEERCLREWNENEGRPQSLPSGGNRLVEPESNPQIAVNSQVTEPAPELLTQSLPQDPAFKAILENWNDAPLWLKMATAHTFKKKGKQRGQQAG